ncbi:Uncharacterised protein [Mycobacteroides abscessus]|nr:Uncharacterised protein [Mycobacteroides abscessus]
MLSPVPIAVAPRLTSSSSSPATSSRRISSPTLTANPANSWPRLMGTASWSCVRPIFRTSANSDAFSSNARSSRRTSSWSRATSSWTARRKPVG